MNSEMIENDRLGQEERDNSIMEGKEGKFSPVLNMSKKPESTEGVDEGAKEATTLVSTSSVSCLVIGRLTIPDQLRSSRSTFGNRLANHAASSIPLQPFSLSTLM